MEKVQCLKSTKLSLHESLIAHLANLEQKKKRFVFERVGGEITSDGPSSTSLELPASVQRSKSLSSCQDLSDSDIVFLFNGSGLPKDTEVVGTLTFTDAQDRPSLLDLTLLAQAVHNAQPSYLLFLDNCYHFSGTMIYVLESKYNSAITMAGTAGKWHGIDLGEPTPTKVADLRSQWEVQIAEFVSCFLC